MKITKTTPIESAFRSFCDSRHRWLIAIAVTFGVALATLLPCVDDYFAGRNERAECAEELLSARADVADFDQFKSRFEEVSSRLSEMDRRVVSKDSLGDFRGKMVELARESNCQLRQMTAGGERPRPWLEADSALDSAVKPGSDQKATGLMLEKQTLALSISGSMEDVRRLLERLQEDKTLLHVKRLDIRPDGREGEDVVLDLELWLYQLTRPSAAA